MRNSHSVIQLIAFQIVFTTTYLLARLHTPKGRWDLGGGILVGWIMSHLLILQMDVLFQIYVLQGHILGETLLLGYSAILIANIMGTYFIGEHLPQKTYMGIVIVSMGMLLGDLL